MKNMTIQLLAWMVLLTSILVMVGWLFGVEQLTHILPGLVSMKFTTSAIFFVTGIALLGVYAREKYDAGWTEIVLPISSLTIAIVMGVTLLSNVFDFRSGLELLFVTEGNNAAFTSKPGTPSIGTMAAFIFIATGVFVALLEFRIRFLFYRLTGSLVAVLGGVALVGYGVDNSMLYYFVESFSSAMAVHTATLFVITGVSLILISTVGRVQRKRVNHK